MNGTWNDLFSGVARANLMIDVIDDRRRADRPQPTIAELRMLRAWYYYHAAWTSSAACRW